MTSSLLNTDDLFSTEWQDFDQEESSSASEASSYHKTGRQNKISRCHRCNKTFKSSADLISHRYTKHAINRGGVHKCQLCPAALSSASALYRHTKRLHRSKQSHTSRPRVQNTEPPSASNRQHQQQTLHSCPHCSSQFRGATALKTHLVVHGERPFECDVCSAHFPYQTSLRVHRRIHFSPKADLRCEICGANFTLPSQLRKHKLHIHHNKDIESPAPDVATPTRTRRSKAVKHVTAVHQVKQEISTNHSPSAVLEAKKSKQMSGLVSSELNSETSSHGFMYGPFSNSCLKKTGDPVAAVYKCEFCSMAFYIARNLTRHKRLKHGTETLNRARTAVKLKRASQEPSDEARKDQHAALVIANQEERPSAGTSAGRKSYQCRFCTEVFRSPGVAKSHLIRSHPLLAEITSKLTKVTYNYRAGVPQTLQARDAESQMERLTYTCKICSQKIASGDLVLKHMKQQHLAEYEPIRCKLSLIDRRNFEGNTHVWQCDICQQMFTRLSQVKQHKKMAHKPVSSGGLTPISNVNTQLSTQVMQDNSENQVAKIHSKPPQNSASPRRGRGRPRQVPSPTEAVLEPSAAELNSHSEPMDEDHSMLHRTPSGNTINSISSNSTSATTNKTTANPGKPWKYVDPSQQYESTEDHIAKLLERRRRQLLVKS